MVINLSEYRAIKQQKEVFTQNDRVRIPIYKRIVEINGIFYGEFENGKKEVLSGCCDEDNK